MCSTVRMYSAAWVGPRKGDDGMVTEVEDPGLDRRAGRGIGPTSLGGGGFEGELVCHG